MAIFPSIQFMFPAPFNDGWRHEAEYHPPIRRTLVGQLPENHGFDRDALINVIGTILAKTTVSGVSSASARPKCILT